VSAASRPGFARVYAVELLCEEVDAGRDRIDLVEPLGDLEPRREVVARVRHERFEDRVEP